MSLPVLPIDIIGRVPCVVNFVIGMTHIVTLITPTEQGSRGLTIVVDKIDTYLVAVGKSGATFTNTCLVNLINITT